MNHWPAPPRRRWLAGALVVLVSVLGLGGTFARSAPALETFDAPAGKVLLTISGGTAKPNDGGGVSFDLAQLQKLPSQSFTTKTPWYPAARKFTGVAVGELLAAVGGATSMTVRAVALNDYRVDIPAEDLVRNGAMLAYLLDDQPMAVRDKGPLVIIYPFDDKPQLRSAVHYSRAIWQLRSIELK